MGILDNLPCVLRNMYAGQEATVRTDLEQWTGSKLGKEYIKAFLSPCLFNLYAEYIMQNEGLDEAQTGIEIARRNVNNLKYVDGTTLMVESKEELKSLVMWVKE